MPDEITTANGYVDSIFAQFFGVMGTIASFFYGLANLSLAPAYAADGASGVATAIKNIKDSLLGAIETFMQ